MDVYEAVDSRRAVRAFSADPVPAAVLERVLRAAARAPSSGSLQPWRIFAVAGEPLAELKRRATARAPAGDPGDEREYPMYPDGLGGPPYADRFTAAAVQRYRALGIDRDDPNRPGRIAALGRGTAQLPPGDVDRYRRTVSDVVGADALVLLCGVSIGYADAAVPPLRTARAELAETVTFVGL